MTKNIQIYETKKIKGKTVVKIDLLEWLRDVVGSNMLAGRDLVWSLVSGEVDTKTYKRILLSSYKRFAAFANFIDHTYIFGDQSQSFHERILTIMLNKIKEGRAYCGNTGGKILGEDNGYMYIGFNTGAVPDLKGVVAIYA